MAIIPQLRLFGWKEIEEDAVKNFWVLFFLPLLQTSIFIFCF